MRWTALCTFVLACFLASAGLPSASFDAEGTALSRSGAPTQVPTTNGTIAIGNLNAQIDGERRLLAQQPPSAARYETLADLLTMRGQFLSRIADYEEALDLAEQGVRLFPTAAESYLARAKAQATFHRFGAALADLDAAAARGANRNHTGPVRAAILQATGRYDEALEIRRQFADARPTIRTLQPLAALEGARGNLESASTLFAAAVASYRDVSPFPIAWGEFQEGRMWMSEGQLERARDAFQAAHGRLPQYATAQGHLAEVQAALGNRSAAIDLLRQPAEQSDDPDYAAQLARILIDDGREEEAAQWRQRAALRYEELMVRYPEAFADHATEFFLAAGNDPARALQLARLNVVNRPTARAYHLLLDAALEAKDQTAICDAAAHVRDFAHVSPDLSRLTARAAKFCSAPS